jgi:hypothetical protein
MDAQPEQQLADQPRVVRKPPAQCLGPVARRASFELDKHRGDRRGHVGHSSLAIDEILAEARAACVAVVLARMSLAAYATVLHLSEPRAALTTEVRAALADKDRLAHQARTARREFENTEASLRTQSASLRTLQHALAEAEDDYRSILQAEEQTLRNANALVDQAERDAAQRPAISRCVLPSRWSCRISPASAGASGTRARASTTPAASCPTCVAIHARSSASIAEGTSYLALLQGSSAA